MRWARRILIAISVVVAMLGVAILLLLTMDLSRFKSNLEDHVSDVTGRQLVIAGTFKPSPALEFDKKRGFLTSTAAIFTGGLSIFAQGVWDRCLSRDDYCQAAIEALESGEIPVLDGKSADS